MELGGGCEATGGPIMEVFQRGAAAKADKVYTPRTTRTTLLHESHHKPQGCVLARESKCHLMCVYFASHSPTVITPVQTGSQVVKTVNALKTINGGPFCKVTRGFSSWFKS